MQAFKKDFPVHIFFCEICDLFSATFLNTSEYYFWMLLEYSYDKLTQCDANWWNLSRKLWKKRYLNRLSNTKIKVAFGKKSFLKNIGKNVGNYSYCNKKDKLLQIFYVTHMLLETEKFSRREDMAVGNNHEIFCWI